MPIAVVVERRLRRPRTVVAAFATDPANDTRWIGALTSVRVLTDGPFGVGSRVERVAAFIGKRIEYVNEVVEHRPGERLVMRSVRAPFPMTVTYEFEGDDDASSVARIRAAGDPEGVYRLAAPLLAAMVRRGIARDLATLQRVLEGTGA